jgi:hypothetical protein
MKERLATGSRRRLGPDARTQQFDEPIEGVVELVRVRMAIAGLEMAEAMERRPQRSGCVHPMVIVEVKARERLSDYADDPFDGFFEFLVASAGIPVGGLVQAGIGHDRLTPRPANLANRFVA